MSLMNRFWMHLLPSVGAMDVSSVSMTIESCSRSALAELNLGQVATNFELNV